MVSVVSGKLSESAPFQVQLISSSCQQIVLYTVTQGLEHQHEKKPMQKGAENWYSPRTRTAPISDCIMCILEPLSNFHAY